VVGFSCSSSRVEFNLARPERRNLHNPATIFSIANTGAMLRIGQERAKEIAALAAEQAVLKC